MSHNHHDPASETPSDDRIGQAIDLAQLIKVLRTGQKRAAELTEDLSERWPVSDLAERIDSFCNRKAAPAVLELQKDALLLERLKVIANQLERKVNAALEAAETRMRELFHEESPATSGGRISFRRVLEKGATKLEDWQRATIDQAARDVGGKGSLCPQYVADLFNPPDAGPEPHPAGAEFSADPSALRNVETRAACFDRFAAAFEQAVTNDRIDSLWCDANNARDREEISHEQLNELARRAEAVRDWINRGQTQNAALDVTAPAKTEGGAQ